MNEKLKDLTLGFIAFMLVAGTATAGAVFAQPIMPTQPICDPSYDGTVCIPPKPPDLDCIEITERNIEVVGNDPHDLDRDSDGIGCEAPVTTGAITEPTPEPEVPAAEEPVPVEPVPTPEAPPVVPSENETQNPEPLPPVTEGNETVPIEGNVTVPMENETAEPEPLPPISNETAPIPIEGNVTIGGENETIPATGAEEPVPPAVVTEGNETGTALGNATETIPVEGNVTVPANATTTENATIDIERAPAAEESLNATQVFDNVVNASAILDERLNEAGDDANETERADIKAALGESLAAMGDTSALIINATNEQLFSIQDIGNSVSEAIDVVTDDGE